MGFKADLQADIESVFCNQEEFFEIHTIDGKEMPISIDEEELLRRNKNSRKSEHESGLHKKQVLFFVNAKDFSGLPKANRILTLDGKKYLVADAKKVAGMYEILLEVANG